MSLTRLGADLAQQPQDLSTEDQCDKGECHEPRDGPYVAPTQELKSSHRQHDEHGD